MRQPVPVVTTPCHLLHAVS